MKKSLIWYLMEVSTFVNSVASSGSLSFGSVLKNLKPPKSDLQLNRAFEEIVVRSLLRMNELWLQQLKEQRRRSEKESRRGAGDDNSSVFSSLTKRSQNLHDVRFRK